MPKGVPHPVGAWQGVSFDKTVHGSDRSDSEQHVLLVLANDRTFWLATQEYTSVEVQQGTWQFATGTLRLSLDKLAIYPAAPAPSAVEGQRKFHAPRPKTDRQPTEWSLEERDRAEGLHLHIDLAAIDVDTAVALRERWIKRAQAGEAQVVELSANSAQAPAKAPAAAATAAVDPALFGTSLYMPRAGACAQSYGLFEGVCVHDRLRAAAPDLGTLVANYKAGSAPPPLP